MIRKQVLPRVSDGRERESQRPPDRSHTYHHFCSILLVTQTNADIVWEGLLEFEYQEVEVTGVILEVG